MGLKKFFDVSKAELRKSQHKVTEIERLSNQYSNLSDDALQNKTQEFIDRLIQGETLDDIMVEAYATVRESSRRVLGMYPFPVQILGGIVLHNGDISEMKTGEGKTLTATMPVYLNALSKKGVHVVTVNEYLSGRDAEDMGELFNWLGLSVGINNSQISKEEKREAYLKDITYTTHSELGFDYLRDNMARDKAERVMRGLNYVIIDEVDSVLIDEARTPLIISGKTGGNTFRYKRIDSLVKKLTFKDYTVDLQHKSVILTEAGIDKVERRLQIDNLYSPSNSDLLHFVDLSLKANYSLHKDIDYVIHENKVKLVDSFTGRVMDGRRFSDGIHQALEAKENVPIEEETQTIASITYQNLFRLYNKLSGMTGTAKTEEEEFLEIYNMRVIPIPTNKGVIRKDNVDMIYPTLESKYKAIVRDILGRNYNEQPILVGTGSVDVSEELSKILEKNFISHEVLNAKNHAREAEIIQNAGQLGAVTIATNMAGRGTDIKLGHGVSEVGGLYVIGTERAESRRIDNQLRGRSGRQGDVGESQFYLSLEDDLMKRFGSDRIKVVLDRFKLVGSDAVIKSKSMMKQIESSQKRVEGNNFDTRKQVLKYDDVLNEQRKVIYENRNLLLDTEDLGDYIEQMFRSYIDSLVSEYCVGKKSDWQLDALIKFLKESGWIPDWLDLNELLAIEDLTELSDLVFEVLWGSYTMKRESTNDSMLRVFERTVLLGVVDSNWTSHINTIADLKQDVQLSSYAQEDPIVFYQKRAKELYSEMLFNICVEVTDRCLKAKYY